ncbi:hypothetical protein, partial [Streptomyces sp. NPDC058953]|uniref:hypothetical protein n=1 Tax=Streptomyces sp. NPDC058953 TaxID=3346676 RepID=UPI0036B73D46
MRRTTARNIALLAAAAAVVSIGAAAPAADPPPEHPGSPGGQPVKKPVAVGPRGAGARVGGGGARG